MKINSFILSQFGTEQNKFIVQTDSIDKQKMIEET